jgi:hypothetical protein
MSRVQSYLGSAVALVAALMFAVPGLVGTAYAASADSEDDAAPVISVNPVEILADEKAAFSRLERCVEATPCEANACRNRYERRVLKELAQTRRIDLTSIMAKAITVCAESPARAPQPIEQAAKPAPAPIAPPIAAATVASVAVAAVIAPTPTPSASAPPQLAGNPAVPPRIYYAVIQYDPSPLRDAEQQRGNCRNERVRITVTANARITWDIREATRTSFWQGRVDQATGDIAVQRDNVRIEAAGGGVAERIDAASATGRFARSRVTFGPCGAGYLSVNG